MRYRRPRQRLRPRWAVILALLATLAMAGESREELLGLHRALFYNEHDGTLETFRPYAAPDQVWLEKTAGMLAARQPAVAAL